MARKDVTNIFTFTQLREEGMLQNFKKSQFQSTEVNRQKRKPGAMRSRAGACLSLSAVRPHLFPMGCKRPLTLCPSRGCFIFDLHCKSSQKTRFLSCQTLFNTICTCSPQLRFPCAPSEVGFAAELLVWVHGDPFQFKWTRLAKAV